MRSTSLGKMHDSNTAAEARIGGLYEQTLRELLARVVGCSVGVILEGSRPDRFRVLAARGLGADPLRTLQGMSGGFDMLEAATRHGCWVTRSGAQATWDPSAVEPLSARARWARATLHAGMAYPIISWEGAALGVLAFYGSRPFSARIENLARGVTPLLAQRIAGHLMGIG